MKTALVIGGGILGCAAAHKLKLKGFDVTIVEKSNQLGGGVRTQWYAGHPYNFGMRHFLTANEKMFEYINSVIPMRRIQEHEFYTFVEGDGKFYSYPIHQDDISLMPDFNDIELQLSQTTSEEKPRNLEELWVNQIGWTLYRKFIENYSKKMWRVEDNKEIDDFNWSPKGVTIRSGERRAWQEKISAFPESPNGFDDFFEIATKDCKKCFGESPTLIDAAWGKYDIVINTGFLDEFFENCYGKLPYIGRKFLPIMLPIKQVFPDNVYGLYYAGKEVFTRIVEYKKFFRNESDYSLIVVEIPCSQEEGGRLYPLPIKAEQAKAQRYLDELPDNFFSIGRHGSYRYDLDIAPSFEQLFEVMEKI